LLISAYTRSLNIEILFLVRTFFLKKKIHCVDHVFEIFCFSVGHRHVFPHEFVVRLCSDNTVVVRECGSDWQSSRVEISEPMLSGYRIDSRPSPEFTSALVEMIRKVESSLAKKPSEQRTINSTGVVMINLFNTKSKKEIEQVIQICRQAATERAGDLWAKFGSGHQEIRITLALLQLLRGREDLRMIIHTDDLGNQCLNFNRNLMNSESTAFPKEGTELADTFAVVRGLDLNDRILEETANTDTLKVEHKASHDRLKSITIPRPEHMKDMVSRKVLAGAGSTFWSNIFHTTPVVGLTCTEEKKSEDRHDRPRDILFHSFRLSEAETSDRSTDWQYFPSYICDMVHTSNSQERIDSIKEWLEKCKIDQNQYYQK
jgi:hypothetical protein